MGILALLRMYNHPSCSHSRSSSIGPDSQARLVWKIKPHVDPHRTAAHRVTASKSAFRSCPPSLDVRGNKSRGEKHHIGPEYQIRDQNVVELRGGRPLSVSRYPSLTQGAGLEMINEFEVL